MKTLPLLTLAVALLSTAGIRPSYGQDSDARPVACQFIGPDLVAITTPLTTVVIRESFIENMTQVPGGYWLTQDKCITFGDPGSLESVKLDSVTQIRLKPSIRPEDPHESATGHTQSMFEIPAPLKDVIAAFVRLHEHDVLRGKQ